MALIDEKGARVISVALTNVSSSDRESSSTSVGRSAREPSLEPLPSKSRGRVFFTKHTD